MFAGPPDNFAERTESDRYDTDALPTLITNATIWTGNKGGNEVILKGEIFLDKGIIKYVGDRAPASLVSGNKCVSPYMDNLDFPDSIPSSLVSNVSTLELLG